MIKKWIDEIPGGFPIAFSNSGAIFYSINNHGDLFKCDLNIRVIRELLHGICPYCRYISVYDQSGAGPELTMIDLFGNVFIYYLDYKIMKKGKIQGLEKGHIISITPFKTEYLLIVANPIQQSTKLIITKNNYEVGPSLNLGYGYQFDVVDLAVNYDKKIAACSFGEKRNDIVVIDLNSFSINEIIPGHKFTVNALCFLPGGEILVTGGNDSALKFWHTSTGKCIFTYKHSGCVTKMLWSEVHKTLFILIKAEEQFDQRLVDLVDFTFESIITAWKFDGTEPKKQQVGTWDVHLAQTFELSPLQETIVTGSYPQDHGLNKRKESKLRLWSISDLFNYQGS